MRILQVSSRDIGGGAERVAWNLFRGYRERGHESRLAVGAKRADDPDVFEIPNEDLRYARFWATQWHQFAEKLRPLHGKIPGMWRISRTADKIAEPVRAYKIWRGHEDFHFPGSYRIMAMSGGRPDILHMHNLHGGYFDLRALPSFGIPLVFTLHDAWLLSGHCAHSFDCDRWQSGCGGCPDLRIYPAIRRDATAYNFKRKRRIYKQTRLYISTPSQWLMDKVQQSMLAERIIETKVIPYGVDLKIFAPGDSKAARDSLNLPQDAHILLFSAASIRKNDFKDYETMHAAMQLVANEIKEGRVIFLALGEDGPPEQIGAGVEIRFVPFQSDLEIIAQYYRAADVYIHAARADTFPNAVLESLACGTPIIGSRVGGIPEQVTDLQTDAYPSGILAPVGDAVTMAAAIIRLLNDDNLRARLGANAADDARRRFALTRQIEAHLDWYGAIIARGNA